VFPQVRNAFELPMDEFEARVREARECESRRRGDDTDPLNAQMKAMEKQLREMSEGREYAK